MRALRNLALAASLAALALAGAAAQPAKTLRQQLLGTWLLTSVYGETPGGKRVEPFGPNAQGMSVFDATGHFTLMLVGPDRPKFASDSRMTGSPAEYAAAARRSLGYFGTYQVDEAAHRLTVHIERSTFPNLDGAERSSAIRLTGDRLALIEDPVATPKGPIVPHNLWQRAKPAS